MWKDVDSAGRAATLGVDSAHALVGGVAGLSAAGIGKAIAKRKGKNIKHGGWISLGSAVTGGEIGKLAGYKCSERIGQDIWNEGDKRIMEYIKSDEETRNKLRKNYQPISLAWRKGEEEKKKKKKNKK